MISVMLRPGRDYERWKAAPCVPFAQSRLQIVQCGFVLAIAGKYTFVIHPAIAAISFQALAGR